MTRHSRAVPDPCSPHLPSLSSHPCETHTRADTAGTRASLPMRAGLWPRGLPRRPHTDSLPLLGVIFLGNFINFVFVPKSERKHPGLANSPMGCPPAGQAERARPSCGRLQACCPGIPAPCPGPGACPREPLAHSPCPALGPRVRTAPVSSGFTCCCQSCCQPWRGRRSSRPARSEAGWARGMGAGSPGLPGSHRLLCPEAPHRFSHRVADQLRATPGAIGSVSGAHGLRSPRPGAAQPQCLLPLQADTEPVVTSGASEVVPRVLPGDPQNLCACSLGPRGVGLGWGDLPRSW